MKKELKDLRIHDLLDDPKLKEAFRRAKPKHWSELTEDEREAQAKEQAEAQQEFVREQRILRVKRVLQSIIEAKCNEPNSRLFTTAEELLEFVVKYESSPSSVSNYEWNKFETILLTRLESLLQVDGKEEEPTETEQDTKREREGTIEPKPPEIVQKILWVWKYGRKKWKLLLVAVFLLFCIWFLSKIDPFSNKGQGKSGANQKNQQTIISKLDKLLESTDNDNKTKLLEKYPAGYVLFGVDSSGTFSNTVFPHGKEVLAEYEFDWSNVKIDKLTTDSLTISFPHIRYKPLNTRLIGTTITINRKPCGKAYRYPLRPKGVLHRIFLELLEDDNHQLIFVIGFKKTDP